VTFTFTFYSLFTPSTEFHDAHKHINFCLVARTTYKKRADLRYIKDVVTW